MKKFLLKIALFYTIIVAVDIVFGIIGDYMFAHAKGGVPAKQMNDLCMNDKYDVLVMGSSRARCHYNPFIIEDSLSVSCYNAGYDGNGIVLAYGIYNLISERYKPKMVVYDLTLGLDFYEYPKDQQNKRYISYLKPYYRYRTIQDIVHRISLEEYYKLYSGLLRYNGNTINLAMQYKNTISLNNQGFGPLKGSMNYEPTNYEDIPIDSPIDSIKLFFLEDFIQRVKTDSVEIVFAISPRYKPVSGNMYVELEKVCAKHDVPILDFYDCENISSDKSLFKDAAHLNVHGAEKYTSVFCIELKDYLRRNK